MHRVRSLLVLLVACIPEMTAPIMAGARLANFNAKNRVPGQYFVLFRSNRALRALPTVQASEKAEGVIQPTLVPISRSSAEQLGMAMAESISAHLSRVWSWKFIGRQGVLIAHATDAEIRLLAKDPRVAYIEPSLTVYPQAETETDAPPQLVRIDQIALPPQSAFTSGPGGTGTYTYDQTGVGVVIAIPDSGIAMGYSGATEEFETRVQKIVDCEVASDCSYVVYTAGGKQLQPDPNLFTSGDCNPNNHGTNLAEIAGGADTGVAKGVEIYAAITTYSCYSSNPGEPGNDSELEDAITYFVSQKEASPKTPFVMVISESPESVDESLDLAVENALAAGITVVVAAGDISGSSCGWSPADLAPTTAVISVSATYSESDQLIPNSATGKCVTLFAPGDPGIASINSAFYPDYNYPGTGTSYAAPVVAGIAALYLQTTPTASPAQVKKEIQDYSNGPTLPTTGPGAIGSGSPNLLAYEFMPPGTPPGYVPPTLTQKAKAALDAVINYLLNFPQ